MIPMHCRLAVFIAFAANSSPILSSIPKGGRLSFRPLIISHYSPEKLRYTHQNAVLLVQSQPPLLSYHSAVPEKAVPVDGKTNNALWLLP
jgi:hypothetical protein